jgi:adenylate cyclase
MHEVVGVGDRRLMRAGAIGLGTAALGVLLMLSPLGLILEERFGLGWLFWARGAIAPPAEVVVVSLDRQSAEQLELPAQIRRWPRSVHTRLIERLTAAGAAVIVFDVMFVEPRDPAEDAELAAAIAGAGRVVLFEALEVLERDLAGLPLVAVATEQLTPPLPMLTDVAAGLAPFPLPHTPDRVSQFWAFKSAAGMGERATLPVVALQRRALAVLPTWLELLQAAGVRGVDRWSRGPAHAAELRRLMSDTRSAFIADPGLGQRVAAQLAALDAAPEARALLRALHDVYSGPASRYLNFYGPAGRVRTIPLRDALGAEGEGASLARDALAGKVVFVGQSELRSPDKEEGFGTVFSAGGIDISGVEIAATALANLLEGRTLRPAGPWLGLALVAAFGLVLGTIAGRLPAPLAIPLALALAGADARPDAARPVRRPVRPVPRGASGARQHQPGDALLPAREGRGRPGRGAARSGRGDRAGVRRLHGDRRPGLHHARRAHDPG